MSSAPPVRARARALLAVVWTLVWIATAGLTPVVAAPRARSATLVVLFTPPATDPLVSRIEAELAAVHIAVRILDVPPESELEAVVSQEIASGASAAIRVLPHSSGTQVWTSDTTAQVLRRRSITGADTSDAATSVVALRTVEFLRASLLNVGRQRSGASAPGTASIPGGNAGSGNAGGGVSGAGIPGTSSSSAGSGANVGFGGSAAGPAASSGAAAAPGSSASSNAAAASPGSSPAGSTPATSSSITIGNASLVPSTASGPTAAARGARDAESQPRGRTTPPLTAAEWERRGGGPADDEPHEAPTIAAPAKPGARAPRADATHAVRFGLAAGPAVVANSGDVGAITAAAIVGGAEIADHVGVEAMALLPLSSVRLTRSEGSSDVTVTVLGAAATYRLTMSQPFLIDFAVGGSAIRCRAAGVAGANVVSTTVDSWSAAAHVRAGAGVELTTWLVARADLVVGAAARRLVVAYTDASQVSHDAGAWGHGFVAAGIGLQAIW